MKSQLLTGFVCTLLGLYLGGVYAAAPAQHSLPSASSPVVWEFKTERISHGNLAANLTYLGESGWEVMSVTGVRWESVQTGTASQMEIVEFVVTAKRQKQS